MWLVLLLVKSALAFTCYPEYSFSWCNNASEASCVHDYAFSVGHFQRKLVDYYKSNKRPPLLEAVFLTRLPKPFQLQFTEGGCAAPLVHAYLLVAEAKLPMDDDAHAYGQAAETMMWAIPESVRDLLTVSWPWREAVERFNWVASSSEEAAATMLHDPAGSAAVTLEIVVVHCRESLEWVETDLFPIAPVGSALTFYEKCMEHPALPETLRSKFSTITFQPCSDPVDGPRGDECLGYLAHIVTRYEALATFTVFLQADPQEHLHFAYLHIVLKMIERGTYAVPFLNLNGARHVRTKTPCLNAVHEAIFGEDMPEALGPYCCAQFVVMDQQVRARPREFYQRMTALVDGSMEFDLCTPGKVTRSTHCYGMEFMWHVVFGEDYEPPLRQDDVRLPTPLRLKYGLEFVKRDWNDVVLAPLTAKKVVDEVEYSQQIR